MLSQVSNLTLNENVLSISKAKFLFKKKAEELMGYISLTVQLAQFHMCLIPDTLETKTWDKTFGLHEFLLSAVTWREK